MCTYQAQCSRDEEESKVSDGVEQGFRHQEQNETVSYLKIDVQGSQMTKQFDIGTHIHGEYQAVISRVMLGSEGLHGDGRKAGIDAWEECVDAHDPDGVENLCMAQTLHPDAKCKKVNVCMTFAPVESFSKAARSTNEKQKNVAMEPMMKTETW